MFDPTKYVDETQNNQNRAVVLPAGDYPVKIVYVNRKDSQSGTPGINLKFQVLDGPHKGKTFFLMFWMSENAAWRLARFMKSWGFAQPFDENSKEELDRVFKGQMGHIRIVQSSFNGFSRNDYQAAWPFTEEERIKYSQGINVQEVKEDDPFGHYTEGNANSANTEDEPPFAGTLEDDPFNQSMTPEEGIASVDNIDPGAGDGVQW